MTDDRGGRRSRHGGEGEGRSAADFLAEWHTGRFPAVQDEPTGPVTGGRRARRRAAEEAARGGAVSRPDATQEDATVRTPVVPGGGPPARPTGRPPVPPVSSLSGLILGSTGEQPAVPAQRRDSFPDTDERPARHERPARGERPVPDEQAFTDEHPTWDQTGGLDVIGADDEDDRTGGRRGGRGGRKAAIGRPRRRRRPVTIALSLLVLAGLVVGIVVGGQWLIQRINPVAADYTGSGSGEVQIRVESGDSLTAIGRTLVEADVIASTGPFVDAGAANPAAAGIQPGVYGMALQMSGQAALDRLLDPAARLFSRVTVPEGMRVDAVLRRIADNSEIPLADLEAAAADPGSLGLPAWANGLLEGHLFPATYDIEPGQTAVDVLRTMVARAQQTFDALQIPESDRLRVLTEASLVQAEASTVEDMARVATVIDNRVAIGMLLQFDTTVNYATGKAGITTTAEDRSIDSPYNTYRYAGLPPGAIDSPGEDAIQAVLNPAPGDWLFFVVVDPDTGDTRFAATAQEHAANVLLFQQWLRENPSD